MGPAQMWDWPLRPWSIFNSGPWFLGPEVMLTHQLCQWLGHQGNGVWHWSDFCSKSIVIVASHWGTHQPADSNTHHESFVLHQVEDKYVRTHHVYSFTGKHQRRTQQQQQTQMSQQQLQQYYQQQYYNSYHQQYHIPMGQFMDRYDKSLRWPAGARGGK